MESGLQHQLQLHSFDGHGRPLCIYGDPAYPVTLHVQGPFKGAHLNNAQKDFNASMRSVRVTVEWPYCTYKQSVNCISLAPSCIMPEFAFMAPQQASFLKLNRPY